MAIKKATKRTATHPRPSLTLHISPVLKRRIKVAAAAQHLPVSAYVSHILEQAIPAAELKPADGFVTLAMVRRADALRKEQKEPFPEDSADLIREAREQRYDEL